MIGKIKKIVNSVTGKIDLPVTITQAVIDADSGKTQNEINKELAEAVGGVAPVNALSYSGKEIPLSKEERKLVCKHICTKYFVGNIGETWVNSICIVDDMMFVGFNGGKIIRLSMHAVERGNATVLQVYSIESTYHCNNMSVHRRNGKTYLLVSKCVANDSECYVGELSSSYALSKVCTIKYNGTLMNPVYNRCIDWVVDDEHGYLYAHGYKEKVKESDGDGTAVHQYVRFSMPELTGTNITLTDEDVIHDISFRSNNNFQAVVIKNNYIYAQTSRLWHSAGDRETLDVVDTATGDIVSQVDLTHLGREQEGIAYYNGHIYFCIHKAEKVGGVDKNLADVHIYKLSAV